MLELKLKHASQGIPGRHASNYQRAVAAPPRNNEWAANGPLGIWCFQAVFITFNKGISMGLG